jgi:hypothetical protein
LQTHFNTFRPIYTRKEKEGNFVVYDQKDAGIAILTSQIKNFRKACEQKRGPSYEFPTLSTMLAPRGSLTPPSPQELIYVGPVFQSRHLSALGGPRGNTVTGLS